MSLKSVSAINTHRKVAINFMIFHSFAEIDQTDWNNAIAPDDIFVTGDYLSVMEKSCPAGLVFRYAIVYANDIPVSALVFQLLNVGEKELGGILNFEDKGWLLQKLNGTINRMLFSCHDRKPNYFISCGSLIVSGEHGISYNNKEGLAFTLNLLPIIFDAVAQSAGDAGICAWAVKDFFDISVADQHLYNTGFSRLPMDPEMIFYVRPEWNTFNDYLQALSAKYRLKANNVLKKLADIDVKELNDTDIERYKADMIRLYLQVQQRSTVRLVKVNEVYFTLLKKKLKDRFYIYGFFKEGKLIAFTCGLVYCGNHEAHFIGIDYSYNRSHQLYQNILYRFIHDAIERRSTRLYFGRTAMEMKTTVGAKAYELHSYFKLDNSFLNKIAKPVISRAASPEWVPRSPFKEGN